MTLRKKPPTEIAGVPVRSSFDVAPPLVYCVFVTGGGVRNLLRKNGLRKDLIPKEALTAAADTADTSAAKTAGVTEKQRTSSDVLGFLSEFGKPQVSEHGKSMNSSAGRDYTVVDRDYIKYDSELNGAFIGRYAAGVREHAGVIGSGGLVRSVGRYTQIDPAAVFGCVADDSGSLTLCGEFLRDISPVGGADMLTPSVRIGNDVHIGANAFINTAVVHVIGDGAVIGANAVVTADVPPYAVMVGNPAKIERYRFLKREIALLNRIRWWDFDDEKLAANADCFADYRLLLERFG